MRLNRHRALEFGEARQHESAHALLLIASFPIRIALRGTQAWLSISTWLASLA